VGETGETPSNVSVEEQSEFDESPTEFSSARAKGHHFLPRSVYKDMSLSAETRKVFDDATTGPIGLRARSEDNVLRGNFWDGKKGAHGLYNDAAKELMDSFMETNGMVPEHMSPNQARLLIERIKTSQDSRIRDFLNSIWLLQYLRRLRIGGRGIE